MRTYLKSNQPDIREGYVPLGKAKLYYREIGQGRSMMILHGGPDFDHNYLLPDLDRLSDSFRLIYYDQRGRGRSVWMEQPEEVTLQSDVEDLEALRKYFRQGPVAVLGHSWGGLLAMEYAVRHPECVSHLILINTAPVSRDDFLLFQQNRLKKAAGDLAELKKRSTDSKYQEGDPDTVAEYYRVHFRTTLRQPEHLEKVVKSLRLGFTKEGILRARKIEDRLMQETWLSSEYNLLPKLRELSIPALIIHGERDFIPLECVAHIAQAIPAALLVLLKETGHFSYLESPDEVHKEINDFFYQQPGRSGHLSLSSTS